MIRGAKGTLAVVALAGLGLALRWMTAGSISGVHSYDLDSMTVLAVGTVAWMAYGWLVLAVVLTVLEQLPGAIGALAGAIAGRITSKTARTLLRSSLGVAAVTPLTVGVAHATPGDGSSGATMDTGGDTLLRPAHRRHRSFHMGCHRARLNGSASPLTRRSLPQVRRTGAPPSRRPESA